MTLNDAGLTHDIALGMIGAGQMGLSLAQTLRATGTGTITLYSQPADAQTRARVKEAGLLYCDTPQGLAQARLVFSAVTPAAAVAAARHCAPALHDQAIYVDLNSLGPSQKREVAQVVLATKRRFVDAAVLGSAADGRQMPIICSGDEAEQVTRWLVAKGMNARRVGKQTGDAAAIKIVRSVLTKGLESLYVEALLAANRMGIAQEVLHSFCDWLDLRPAAASAELLVTSHLLHAERRMYELEMSVAAVREVGVAPLMAQATHERLALTAATGVAAQLNAQPASSLDEALKQLSRALP